MDTDAIDAGNDALVRICYDSTFQNHGDDACGGISGVVQHRAGARPFDEKASVRIGAIRVDFAGDRKSVRVTRRFCAASNAWLAAVALLWLGQVLRAAKVPP